MYFRYIQLKSKANKQGLAPIYARITINKQRLNISTSIFCKPNEFNVKKQRVKGNKSANQRLTAFKNDIENKYAHLFLQGNATAEDLKQLLRPESRPTLFALLQTYHNYKIKNAKIGSLKAYKAQFNNLRGYTKLRKSYIKDVDQPFLNQLVYYLNTQTNINSPAYLRKNIGYLTSSIKYACTNGVIKHNPFKVLELPKVKSNRKHPLTKDELHLLLTAPVGARLHKIQLLAKLQAYTGLAYCDLMRLNKDWLQLHQGQLFLVGDREKTKSEFIIPLVQNIQAILERKNFTLAKISNQKYNAYLRELAKQAGIDRHISSHYLRCTFGQLMIDKGYSLETVAKMLGHNRVTTTLKHYAQLSKWRVVEEVVSMIA